MIFLCDSNSLKNTTLLFTTKFGMAKLVDSSEFDVMKKTVLGTKLNEGDLVVSIDRVRITKEVYSRFTLDGETVEEEVIESNQIIVLKTAQGTFLKFPLSDIPEKKKGAVGVRAIKLADKDYIDEVYVISDDIDITIEYKGKQIETRKLKLAHRDTKGTKVRV